MNPSTRKNAVVTGGARGIGLACARRLIRDGIHCVLWDRDVAALSTAVSLLNTEAGWDAASSVGLDLTKYPEVVRAVGEVVRDRGSIDVLVNNAGIAGVSKPLWECSIEEWTGVIEINLVGVFHCCHAVVPTLLKQGSGRIINIASIAGKEGNPNASHYSAAKAGVMALTKSLGKELATQGILVNCITPAVIATELLQQCSPEHVKYMLSKIPMGRPGQPEEVAAMVAWLASPECSFSTGAVFDLSGGRATY